MVDEGLLTDSDVKGALAELPGWKQQGKALAKKFDMQAFKAAVAFANTVAELSERADHHPDILIQYRTVTLTLSSHDAGGITGRDMRLARQIEAAAKDQRA